MPRSTLRRLTLADLAILIAATAFALFFARIVREQRLTIWKNAYVSESYRWGIDASPFLLSACVALLTARWIGPRPPFRRLARQPGALACLMIVAALVLNASEQFGQYFLLSIFRPGNSPSLEAWPILMLGCWNGGVLVAACWVTLVLAGRWRPEPSWVDRSGRVLGVIAILGSIALGLIP
jgi:hypothetical protein